METASVGSKRSGDHTHTHERIIPQQDQFVAFAGRYRQCGQIRYEPPSLESNEAMATTTAENYNRQPVLPPRSTTHTQRANTPKKCRQYKRQPIAYLRGYHDLPHSPGLHPLDALVQPRDDVPAADDEAERVLLLVEVSPLRTLARLEQVTVVACERGARTPGVGAYGWGQTG